MLVDVDAAKCCIYGTTCAMRGLVVGSIVICVVTGDMG